MKYTNNYSAEIKIIKEKIKCADAILVGAGSGLSASAGYVYSGERFNKYFSDFGGKYGFTDMYSGGFYPFETAEEMWAYWSEYIYINRYLPIPNKNVFDDLILLVKEKEYFVLTTNVDHCFQRTGFDKSRLFYTQGDFGLFQCSEPCHNKTYDNLKEISNMRANRKGFIVPKELHPVCPVCKKPMTMNLRSDDRFVEDEGWHAAAARYNAFLQKNINKRIVLLELGVGGNTPVIIKYPFWRIAAANENAFYVCVNLGENYVPDIIKNRSVVLNEDIGKVLHEVLKTP